MSYNKELLKAWNGHINVQRVTKLGLVRYLVKYVSKIEPTFTLSVKEMKTEVEKYFTTRLISGALRTGSRQKTGIEHQHSRTHIMKAINETDFIVLVDVLLT